MVGELRYRDFDEHVFRPVAAKIMEETLKRGSPKHLDIMERGEHCGRFTPNNPEERFVKNCRMICKHAEGGGNSTRHKKLVTGLSQSGYWIPLVGWENEVLGYAVDSALDKILPRGNTMHFGALRGGAHCMWQRFCTGQAALDADTQQRQHRAGGEDRRDAARTATQLRVKLVLMQCPANVITLPLLSTFCSPTSDALKSKTAAMHRPAREEVRLIFEKMREWRLGRVFGIEERLRFQKLHAAALSPFARELLVNDLRVPLWVFGAHLPPPTPEVIAAHNDRLAQAFLAAEPPSQEIGNGLAGGEQHADETAGENFSAESPTEMLGVMDAEATSPAAHVDIDSQSTRMLGVAVVAAKAAVAASAAQEMKCEQRGHAVVPDSGLPVTIRDFEQI